MERNRGIITILIGVGLLFISFVLSSGSQPKRDFLGNISKMEIVFVEGEYVTDPRFDDLYAEKPLSGHYEGRVAIPLKYPLSLSVVLILLGTGILLMSKRNETNA